jgi:hypothetical protein
MSSCKVNKDVFKARIPGGQSRQMELLQLQMLKQSRDRNMRFRDGEGNPVAVGSHFLYSREFRQLIIRRVASVRQSKLHNVLASQSSDQFGRRAQSDDLAMIYHRHSIAQTLGFVHVMGCEEDRPPFFLQFADDIPQVPPGLGIQSGRRLVQEQEKGIPNQRASDGKPLALTSRKLSHPGLGFLAQANRLHHLGRRVSVSIKTAEQSQCFKNGESFGKTRFLKGDSYPLAQLAVIPAPSHAENFHITRGGTQKPFKDFDGRRFACSVGAQEPEAFAAMDHEVNSVYGLNDSSSALVLLAQGPASDYCFEGHTLLATSATNHLTYGS